MRPKPNIDGEPLLMAKDLARMTGFRTRQLEDAARAGDVPAVRLGKTWYFLLSTFTEAVAAQARFSAAGRTDGSKTDLASSDQDMKEAMDGHLSTE